MAAGRHARPRVDQALDDLVPNAKAERRALLEPE
jgi:hypothetical protein